MLQDKRKVMAWFYMVCMVSVLSGCTQKPEAVACKESAVHTLSVDKVTAGELPVFYTTVGSTISDNRIQVTSRIAGYIEDISVQEGQTVSRGDLLVLLDSSDIDGAILQAEAAVNKCRSALRDAQTDLERYEELFKEKSIPENALRKVRLQRDVSRESLHAALAALEIATSQLQYIRIKSPVDGVIVARQKRKGDLATPGVPIISIESEKALLFKSFVPESQIQNIVKNDRVSVVIDALSKTLNGHITRIIPSGDPVTRSYEIKISLDDTTGLLPGMFGYVQYTVGTETSPVIARTAVVERGGLHGVFVVDADQKARFRWLRFGREWPDSLQVQTGVTPGERIVTSPVAALADGDFIKSGDNDE